MMDRYYGLDKIAHRISICCIGITSSSIAGKNFMSEETAVRYIPPKKKMDVFTFNPSSHTYVGLRSDDLDEIMNKNQCDKLWIKDINSEMDEVGKVRDQIKLGELYSTYIKTHLGTINYIKKSTEISI